MTGGISSYNGATGPYRAPSTGGTGSASGAGSAGGVGSGGSAGSFGSTAMGSATGSFGSFIDGLISDNNWDNSYSYKPGNGLPPLRDGLEAFDSYVRDKTK